MNPLDQRIAIAEANGREWTKEDHQDSGYKSWQDFAASCGIEVIDDEIPDYLNDLNAMHEVERNFIVQGASFAECLAENLACVVTGEELDQLNYLEVAHVMSATSTQRAEAYLRTINKWKD